MNNIELSRPTGIHAATHICLECVRCKFKKCPSQHKDAEKKRSVFGLWGSRTLFVVAFTLMSASMIPLWALIPVSGYRNNSDGSLNNVGSNGYVWSSAANSQNNAYNLNFNSSNVNPQNNNNRANGFSVRPVEAFAWTGEFVLCEYMKIDRNLLDRLLTIAYLDARRNERTKASQVAFEVDLENNLRCLRDELWKREYKPSPPMCFMIDTPREVFAPLFRDRIVSHLLFNMIAPLFEDLFIYDSYSCRKGKGTLKGIQRMEKHIRSCSENYTKRTYVLCLDVSGYFMSINKGILYRIICEEMQRHKSKWECFIDYEFVDYLLDVIIFRNPTIGCTRIGDIGAWDRLPPHKSLFNSKIGTGLMIGDVTSQLFSNIYMNPADNYIKRVLKCRCYGRYVDDMRIVGRDKGWLIDMAGKVDEYLKANLSLRINPKKTRIIKAERKVDFLGAECVRFGRYAKSGTIAKFARVASLWNGKSLSSINSYLGYLKHFRSDISVMNVINTIRVKDGWEYDKSSNKIIFKSSDYEKVSGSLGVGTASV